MEVQLAKFVKSLSEFVKSYSAWVKAYFVKPPVAVITPPVEKKIDREGNLIIFCNAIKDFEGYTPISRSYRNNNPGNITYGPFAVKELGAIGSDGRFAKWNTYEDGFNALKKFVLMASKNELGKYKDC